KEKDVVVKLLISNVNMLVLDETTNFLDIESLKALETLNKDYRGTVIFVIHDRMLIKNVETKIIELENKEVTVFDGTYEAYKERVTHPIYDDNKDKLLFIVTKICVVF